MDSTAEMSGGSSDSSDSSGDTDDDEPLVSWPARGISITQVEVNQGVAVAVGEGSEWVDGASRNTHLIAGRRALVRVHVELDEGWEAREVEARLVLDNGDEQQTLSHIEMVSSAATYFWFDLAADSVFNAASTTYRVELHERSDGAGASLSEGTWANPADGPGYLGFEADPMELKLVIVPIHVSGLIDHETVVAVEEVEALRERVMSLFPVTEVELRVREPAVFEGSASTIVDLLDFMEGVRYLDGAAPNEYYLGLVSDYPELADYITSIASTTSDEMDDERAGVLLSGLKPDSDEYLSAEYVEWAMGILHGRIAVECLNGATEYPNVDPNYPYEGGEIGVWGFDVVTSELREPDEYYSYMTSCWPAWVSDYGWNLAVARVRTLTSWDYD